MLILLNIETLPPDLQNLPADTTHKLTFKVMFTIRGVPDSFTGMVFENTSGELQLAHFNNPRGNKRKMITLKNKMIPGSFEHVKQWLFTTARGETVSFPQQLELAKKPPRRKPGT
jgi:hypothetical protein